MVWRTSYYIGAAIAVCLVVVWAIPPAPLADSLLQNVHMPQGTVASQRILFVGDMSFDRYIRKMSMRYGEDHPFSCVDELLQSADIVVGNLEGSITEYPSVSIDTAMGSTNNYVFTSPTTTAPLLARHNVGIVNLGNNHIGDLGHEGIASTKRYLSEAGVHYFGGLAGDSPVYRKGSISFVSFNQFGGESVENTARSIADEKASGQTVIVYAHWGEEYSQSLSGIGSAARLFVANGASAIIGSHPHVVIPRRDIAGVPVYYSLGNFIFDQYWDDSVTSGLAVLLTIDGAKVHAQEYQVSLQKDGRTCVVD